MKLKLFVAREFPRASEEAEAIKALLAFEGIKFDVVYDAEITLKKTSGKGFVMLCDNDGTKIGGLYKTVEWIKENYL